MTPESDVTIEIVEETPINLNLVEETPITIELVQTGAKGDDGADGVGVPTGGTTNQVLAKASDNDNDTEWKTLDNEDVGAAPTSHTHTESDITDFGDYATEAELTAGLATKANSSHTHPTTDLTATGGTSTSFLTKDNTWATPTNTTYSEITEAEINAGTASTLRTITGRRIGYILAKAYDRANHTGTQPASTISDFDAEVENNAEVSANTSARHTHANKTILDNTTASFTSSDETKLDGIEANADVTDATNVAAAGAYMKLTDSAADVAYDDTVGTPYGVTGDDIQEYTDNLTVAMGTYFDQILSTDLPAKISYTETTTADMDFVIDEDNMASNSDTKIPTQQSVKAYADKKGALSYEVFTSSGTWTKPDGAKVVEVFAIGGGGGGGKGAAGAAGTNRAGGSGGGAGGAVIGQFDATGLDNSVAVTVGAGGAAGTVSGAFNQGGDGGASSFGTYVSAGGGVGGPSGNFFIIGENGGAAGASSLLVAAGGGGVYTGLGFQVPGGNGHVGSGAGGAAINNTNTTSPALAGGNSSAGAGGAGGGSSSAGGNGTNGSGTNGGAGGGGGGTASNGGNGGAGGGGGGGGGAALSPAVAGNGGAGGAGIVIVITYG